MSQSSRCKVVRYSKVALYLLKLNCRVVDVVSIIELMSWCTFSDVPAINLLYTTSVRFDDLSVKWDFPVAYNYNRH